METLTFAFTPRAFSECKELSFMSALKRRPMHRRVKWPKELVNGLTKRQIEAVKKWYASMIKPEYGVRKRKRLMKAAIKMVKGMKEAMS